MLGLRMDEDCQPRTKNGQPAHSTTGKRQHQLDPGLHVAMSNHPRRWPNIARMVTMTVSGSVHQKRR
jgi:hypothetical protein